MVDLDKLVQACFEAEPDSSSCGVSLIRRRMLVDPHAMTALRRSVAMHTGEQELERLTALIRELNDHLLALAGRQIVVNHTTSELIRRARWALAMYGQ